MSITKRDQILLVGMVILLASFAYFRFVYMPVREEIRTLSTTKQELQQEQKRLELAAKKKPELQQHDEQKYVDLNKRLPKKDELVPLIAFLESSCKKYKIPLASMDYKGAEPKDPVGAQTLVFTVGTKGMVTQLFDFLNELETNQRLISVEQVSLTAVKAISVADTATVETGPPAYYIAPPGIPQAKLQRITFEVQDAEQLASEAEVPVAASFEPNTYEMKITINAYYAAQPEPEKAKDRKSSQNAKGEV